jgi:hypothetical protein
MGWVVNPHHGRFTHGKDLVPIVYEAGWAARPVWRGVGNLAPTGIRSLDRPARSELLNWLSYSGPQGKGLEISEWKRRVGRQIHGWQDCDNAKRYATLLEEQRGAAYSAGIRQQTELKSFWRLLSKDGWSIHGERCTLWMEWSVL